jgi:spore maturation protein CgeB
MRIALFCHSLLSDWNHGNAHFLRGIVSELAARGHAVRVFEPRDAWSVANLVADHGPQALDLARRAFPEITPIRYQPERLELDRALAGCNLVIVHEWNEPGLVQRLGEHRRAGGHYRLLFHDTHHRAATRPEEIRRFDLSGYDGVLAFGEAVRQIYLRQGWAARAFTWHEAADVRRFFPQAREGDEEDLGDVAWIGNWGDGERTAELSEFLFEPIRSLGLRASIYGVRYPSEALRLLEASGARYGGWLPNVRVPAVLAGHRFTVHVPRRAYVRHLPGIPTIRPFEALACGAPLVSAPWEDVEGLFTPGKDYLVARSGDEMRVHMKALASDAALRAELGARGRATVLARHTCAHRVDELLAICGELGIPMGEAVRPQSSLPTLPASPTAAQPTAALPTGAVTP